MPASATVRLASVDEHALLGAAYMMTRDAFVALA